MFEMESYYQFLCAERLNQVSYVFERCWYSDSIVSTVIGLNIVSVCRSSIKVMWCCLYVVLSWEIDVDQIISKHQRRRRICFKKIVTPLKTRRFQSLTNLFPYFFIFKIQGFV